MGVDTQPNWPAELAMLHSSSSRSAPLLQSDSMDKRDALAFASYPPLAPPPNHVTRPRPEIILRWKRFALLVLLSATLISALAVTLWIGIPLSEESDATQAEKKTELFNSYTGVVMGFAESVVGELLGYLFPVFIVYLHNLKWSKMDDPATRPISKAKKIALLLFFPIVMIAIGNSLSAVQTNTSGGDGGDGAAGSGRQRRLVAASESAMDDTPLRSSVRGQLQPMAEGETNGLGLDRVARATRVALGFPLHDWADELLPVDADAEPDSSLHLTLSGASDATLMKQAGELVAVSTAGDLLRQGVASYEQLLKEAGVVTDSKAAQQTQSTTSMHDVLTMARSAFNTSGVQLTLERRQLHTQIQLELLTVQVLLPGVQAVETQCGKESCVAFSADPRARLRSLVAASQFTPSHCGHENLSECPAEPNAAFVYGSSLSVSDATGYSLTLTFAKLSWQFSSNELCDDASMDAAACHTLSFQLPQSRRHLVLNALLAPSPEHAQRLVQIVQPPLVSANQLVAATLMRDASPSRTAAGVADEVDRFGAFQRSNRLMFDDKNAMPRTLHAASLLFLFQHAIVTPSAATSTLAWQRHLLQAAGATEFQVYVSNTRFGAIATWTACGILFFLSSLVLLFPNARARLEPPKGGNARAERFIAVQTEEVYPNLIYKKRFRIGKTGEKIKFREFAVEAVTLHHKMEEDEQIYL